MNTDKFLTFYRSMSGIVRDIKKKEMSYMRDYGLRSVHLKCLLKISTEEGGMTATELSHTCGVDKALTSRVLRELYDGGFVTYRSGGGRRAYKRTFVLTDRSERIIADFDRDITECIVAARGDISAEDMNTFYRVLFELEKNISRITNDPEGDHYGS